MTALHLLRPYLLGVEMLSQAPNGRRDLRRLPLGFLLYMQSASLLGSEWAEVRIIRHHLFLAEQNLCGSPMQLLTDAVIKKRNRQQRWH